MFDWLCCWRNRLEMAIPPPRLHIPKSHNYCGVLSIFVLDGDVCFFPLLLASFTEGDNVVYFNFAPEQLIRKWTCSLVSLFNHWGEHGFNFQFTWCNSISTHFRTVNRKTQLLLTMGKDNNTNNWNILCSICVLDEEVRSVHVRRAGARPMVNVSIRKSWGEENYLHLTKRVIKRQRGGGEHVFSKKLLSYWWMTDKSICH